MWYSNKVGENVKFVREESDCYISIEDAGYTNIVLKEDGVIVMALFDDLMNLTETTKSFFCKDFEGPDGATYRIFNYRLAGWEEFQTLPGALECRGTMFRKEGESWVIVSRPMEKFFNAHEGSVDHNWENPMSIMTKEDGSLISTYLDTCSRLALKSKGSLSSTQVQESAYWLSNRMELVEELRQIEVAGYTTNMEYVSPTNRIVLSYEKPELVILNFRNRETGEYVSVDTMCNDILRRSNSVIREFMVKTVETENPVEFIESIYEMTGIEGYVVQKENGEYVKLKTTEYITLHNSKDSVNNPKALFSVVIEDASDDLRTMFDIDQTVLDTIGRMEEVVIPIYNKMVVNVEEFFENNKELERKDYAIKGQNELDAYEFGLAMSMYVGKTVDFKKTMLKRWQSLSNSVIESVYGIGYEYGG